MFKNGEATHRAVVEFDAAHNNLIKRVTSTIQGKAGIVTTMTRTVTAFTEIQPGVYFPTASELISAWDGGSSPRTVFAETDIRLNNIADDRAMALSVPNGARVADLEKGVFYKSNAQGQPVGEVRPIIRERPPASALPEEGTPTSETTEEPPSVNRWVVFFLAMLIVSLIFYLYRRITTRRRRL